MSARADVSEIFDARLACMAEEAVEGRDSFLEKRPADFSRSPWHA